MIREKVIYIYHTSFINFYSIFIIFSFYLGGGATMLREIPYQVLQQTSYYFLNRMEIFDNI